MKKITILLLSIFILFSCSIDYDNSMKNEIIELKETIKNSDFEKNKECALLQEKILIDIDKNTAPVLKAKLTEIFYSQKTNSCLYVMEHIQPICLDILYNHKLYDAYYCNGNKKTIVNFFTKKIIYSTSKFKYISCIKAKNELSHMENMKEEVKYIDCDDSDDFYTNLKKYK